MNWSRWELYRFHKLLMLLLMKKMDKTILDYLMLVECDMHYRSPFQCHLYCLRNPNVNSYPLECTVIISFACRAATKNYSSKRKSLFVKNTISTHKNLCILLIVTDVTFCDTKFSGLHWRSCMARLISVL